MFLKSVFIASFTLLFSSCTMNNFYLNNDKNFIYFPLENGEVKKITLSKPKYENTFSQCSQDTYKLSDENYEYGKLFIEHISLEHSCSWNGLASGYFTYELKNRLKFNSFKLVNRFTKFNYEISTYKINDEKYVDIIDIFSVDSNILIIDNKGKLSSMLISKLDSKYEYKYLNEPRSDLDYNYSLVDNNMIFSYFGRESLNDYK